MANLAKWAAGGGVGLTWTTAFGASDFNSLANGSVAVSTSAVIANGTALDIYADISYSLTTQSGTGTPLVAFYMLPLNQDGTTYGDGTVSGTTAPVGTYSIGSVLLQPSKTAGTVHTGTLRMVVLPPGSFKLAMQNAAGFAFGASGHSVKYRTYVENNNG
jgi:hypothetical protein